MVEAAFKHDRIIAIEVRVVWALGLDIERYEHRFGLIRRQSEVRIFKNTLLCKSYEIGGYIEPECPVTELGEIVRHPSGAAGHSLTGSLRTPGCLRHPPVNSG
jgi:hypothetical protein